MIEAVAAAAGALLIAILNELRANVRAREADRDRKLRESAVRGRRRDRGPCDGVSCSPGGRSGGGCGCDDISEESGP
jgi:hypothetical protein